MYFFYKSLGLLMLSLALHAGTSTFIGHGTSEPRDPEFINVEISVASYCYETPSAAMSANNHVTQEVQSILKKLLIESPLDAVRIQGGITRPSSRTVYKDGESKIICPGAFEQLTHVSFKTANIKNFSEIFASMQEQLLGKFVKDDEDSDDKQTFVSIGRPSAQVCAKTSNLMALEATKNAYEHARAQFNAVASACRISGDVEVTSFGDVNNESYSRKSYNTEAMSAPSSRIVALSFEPLSESATLSVSFTYGKTVFTCFSGLY
jgi:hypothetical protein